jgi:hypothetical protein
MGLPDILVVSCRAGAVRLKQRVGQLSNMRRDEEDLLMNEAGVAAWLHQDRN